MPHDLALPRDLVKFYELCGGACLFKSMGLGWRVCRPDELVPVAPRLLTSEIARELERTEPEHVANTCYVFADDGGSSTDEHLVVDLHPSRLGRYYETFWDRFGGVGDMPVVALCLADALSWLLETEGQGAEVALERHPPLGDALDS